MKKFLLIIVGIILFAIIAFSGAVNAFYDTTVSLTIPVVHAEEIEGDGEAMLEEEEEEETIVEEPEVSESEEVVEPEAEEPAEEAEEPIVDEGEPEEHTEAEEPTDAEEVIDEEPATEETELLGDKLLTLARLKDIIDEIGLDAAKKIGLGIVAVGSFLEAIIVLNIFKKKQDRAPKAARGPRPPRPRRHRKHTREIPIEGYREPSRREGIKF